MVLRLGVLASGRGSNLQAIIDAIGEGRLQAEVAVVLSNAATAAALERARRHGIEALYVDPKAFPDRAAYDRKLVEILRGRGVELVCLAGYMRIITREFIDAFPYRIMNIHPALLPSFPGVNAQRQAWEYGVKISGCTVHFVEEGMDTGPIILQAAVPVEEDDTPETLAERILAFEHQIYPRAIQLYAEGRLRVEGRRVRILPPVPVPVEGEAPPCR